MVIRKTKITFVGLALGGLLLTGCLGGSGSGSKAPESGENPDLSCRSTMDETLFADASELRALMTELMSHGQLRSTGSDAEQQVIDWVESELQAMGGFEFASTDIEIQRWQPAPSDPDGPGRSLELAGRLSVEGQVMPVAGAVPYSLGTGEEGVAGELLYLPSDQPIGPEHAGKVIIRDVVKTPFPNSFLMADAYYFTPDQDDMDGFYERPYLVASYWDRDLIAAGQAGAAAVIFAFDVPREQVNGYFDPHSGTHYRLPALFVGVDESELLKVAANGANTASVTVLAERDTAITRNLVARLPGQKEERIAFFTNTDGNTWVQENGVVGMLALARYFSAFPTECRSHTLEFAFNTGHLHMSRDGSKDYLKGLDGDYDEGTVAFAFALEHLGTREILPVPRDDGPGYQLEFTGKDEGTSWFVAEGHQLMADLVINALQTNEIQGMSVLPGMPLKGPTQPSYCSFGGMGTYAHSLLIPTMAIISGPWSLWAPSFGEDAIDFARMNHQLRAVGDVVLALDDLPREAIAGPYLAWREAREQGGAVCTLEVDPPEEAPL